VSRTRNLRRQHDAAVALVEEIVAATLSYAGREDAVKISLLLAKLHGSLRIHFAQEDCALYPFMINSAHPDAATIAELFQSEMGSLGPAFGEFAERWSAADAIAADFATFRQQSEQVFGALLTRIERENTILYPLAEEIRGDQILRSA
jgi:iron-sulfur cluster repair protein YtfE (RIC family)